MDERHSLALLTAETFSRGLAWLSEGCCPCCGAVMQRVTAHDGQQAGLCPSSKRLAYRMEQDPVHGPTIVATTVLDLVACHKASPE